MVVPLALEALGRHPVRAADSAEPIACAGIGYLRGQSEIAHHRGHLVAALVLLDQHVLRREIAVEEAAAV